MTQAPNLNWYLHAGVQLRYYGNSLYDRVLTWLQCNIYKSHVWLSGHWNRWSFIYLFILSMQHPLVSSTCHSRLFNGVLKCHYIFSGRHRVGKQFYFLLNTKLNVCDARTDIIQIIFFLHVCFSVHFHSKNTHIN